MRPCPNCGNPIDNNLTMCIDCIERPVSPTETDANANAANHSSKDDGRRGIRKFLWWSFAVLVILIPATGYLLGGPAFAIMFGLLGVLSFGLLEQFSH